MAKRYGTISGVFIPSIVTILGVIMYLRQGWIVGNAGFLGATLILIMSVTITGCTALSVSSVATNTRLHAGGAYAIISRSLGLETGTTMGFLLYTAQVFAIVMYIFGFREGWLALFPTHSPVLIDICSFAGIFSVTLFSTQLAFRLQYAVFSVTLISILSVSHRPFQYPIDNWIGNFQSLGGGYSGFWKAFAVFFPACTGILAGANMSGQLQNPRTNIPRGTIAAVVFSATVYLWLMVVFSTVSPEKLRSNFNIMTEISLLPSVVGLAIIGATFSAGMATMVGAPRILQALAKDHNIPLSRWLQQENDRGDPKSALLCTGLIVSILILARDLNAIAPLITVCFLATYGVLNIVVLIEQRLGMLSFRPTLTLPLIIPCIGASSAVFAMFVINPTLSFGVWLAIGLGYVALNHAELNSKYGDVRSNFLLAISRWSARTAKNNLIDEGRAWLPHPVIPVFGKDHSLSLRHAITLSSPNGAIRLLSYDIDKDHSHLEILQESGLFFNIVDMEQAELDRSLPITLHVIAHDFFPPNILMLSLDNLARSECEDSLLDAAIDAEMGIILHDSEEQPDEANWINVWIRPALPSWQIEEAQKEGNIDLTVLLAIRLSASTGRNIRLITSLNDATSAAKADLFLEQLIVSGRLPKGTQPVGLIGNIRQHIMQAPKAGINIFGLAMPLQKDFLQLTSKHTYGTCFYVKGSGRENIFS